MTWKSGLILRIKNYTFEDDGSTRDKYTIVLFANDKFAYLIHSLTTSQNNFQVQAASYGCSVHKNIMPYYFFPQNQIIGTDDFSFEKDTYIFFQSNIRKENFSKFDAAAARQIFGVTNLGTLTNDELKRVIKCALKSRFITKEIEAELTTFKTTL